MFKGQKTNRAGQGRRGEGQNAVFPLLPPYLLLVIFGSIWKDKHYIPWKLIWQLDKKTKKINK